MHLQKIEELLKHSFPESWDSKYSFDKENTDPDLKTGIENFSKDISSLQTEIFNLLNISVLKGEYILDNFKELLKKVETTLKEIPTVIPQDPEVQEYILLTLNTNFVQVVNTALRRYIRLFYNVQSRIQNKQSIFYDAILIGENIKFAEPTRKHIEFFISNLNVAWYDHFLRTDEDHFNRLVTLSHRVISYDNNELAIVVKKKCDFLISKWLLRQLLKNTYTDNHIGVYKIDSDLNNTKIEFSDFQNEFSKELMPYITTHYEFATDWKQAIYQHYTEYQSFSIEDIKLWKLHRLIKYFKDVNPNLELLQGIVTEITRRLEKCKKEECDHKAAKAYAYSIALLYAMNNEFSLMIALNLDPSKIDDYYNKIRSFQSQSGLKNFFTQYKYLGYLVGILQKTYSDRKALENMTTFRQIIDRCEKIFEVYQENVRWSRANYNYVFQLPPDQCLFKIESKLIDEIFISSSFIIPIWKEKYLEDFEENKRKFHTLKSSIELFENIEVDINTVKQINENFNAQKSEVDTKVLEIQGNVKEREIKSMETLGIFTALVTFVLGSIANFKFVETPYQAFMFMVTLSFSLALFLILLSLVNKGAGAIKKYGVSLFGLLCLAGVLWYLFITRTKDPATSKIEKELNSRIDSVKKSVSEIKFSSKDMKTPTDSSSLKSIPFPTPNR